MPWSRDWSALTPGADIQAWEALTEFWWAANEKQQVLGGEWPVGTYVFDTGTTTAVSLEGNGDYTFSMPTTDLWFAGIGSHGLETCGDNRWVDYTCFPCSNCYDPQFYDIVIVLDDRDPTSVIRARINAQTISTDNNSGTVTVNGRSIRDAITAKFLDSYNSLSGKTYCFVQQGEPVRLDRTPEKPNEQELWLDNGAVDESHWPPDDSVDPNTGVVTHGGPLYSTITVQQTLIGGGTPNWIIDKWVGKEVLINGSDGLLRLPVIHNDGGTLYLTHRTDIGSDLFSIIEAGAKGNPYRKKWRPFQWYSGAMQGVPSHSPDDTIAPALVPQKTFEWVHGYACEPGHCDDDATGHQRFDTDFLYPGWKSIDGRSVDVETATCNCGLANRFGHRDLPKTFRAIQNMILDVCANYVDKDYAGGAPPNQYTPATLFHAAGINAGVSTIQWQPPVNLIPGYYYFDVSAKYIGSSVHYTTRNAKSETDISGYEPVDLSGRVVANYGNLPPTELAANNPVGRRVTYSAGWSRVRPYLVQFPYEKTSFMPDVIQSDEDAERLVADPPLSLINEDSDSDRYLEYTCEGTGKYITRERSTASVVVGDDGSIASTEMLVTGRLYRVTGNNFLDPFPGTVEELLLQYEDNFFRGRLSKANQSVIDNQKVGEVTEGGKSFITDTAQNWWLDWANAGHELDRSSQMGTATSGSTTSLVDSHRHMTDPHFIDQCWWSQDRFETGSGPYVGFILEIDKQVEDPETHNTVTRTHKVPITSTTIAGDTIIIHFDSFFFLDDNGDEQTFTVSADDPYRIKEPAYEVNKWKGRKLLITTPDGDEIGPIDIRYSDDTTLFFDGQDETIPVGSQYVITELSWGGVYRWNGTEFVDPTDPTVIDFDDCQRTNTQEDLAKDYGRIRFADLFGPHIFVELYNTLNLLKKTTTMVGWTSQSDPAANTPEKNSKFINPPGPYGFSKDSMLTPPAYNPQDAAKNGWDFAHNFVVSTPSGPFYPFAAEGIVNGPPQFSSGFYVAMAYDPWNSPERDAGFVQLSTQANYAYPTITVPGAADRFSYTTTVYGYGMIAFNDPPEGPAVDTDPSDWYTNEAGHKFDAKGSGMEYHKWKELATFGGGEPGDTLIGPQVGNKDAEEAPQVVAPTKPDNPHQDGPTFNATIQGYSGYVVGQTVGVNDWDLEFMNEGT